MLRMHTAAAACATNQGKIKSFNFALFVGPKRQLQQLKWVKNSKNPEDTRIQLESWLPREYWPNMNLVWVGLGQEIREDKVKLVLKAKESSDPTFAIHLLRVFGIDVNKICKKEGI